MGDELMFDDPEVKQPTSYGRPRHTRTSAFYSFYAGILNRVANGLRIVAVVELVLVVCLLAYLSFGVEYVMPYASDGTIFSCLLHPIPARK